MRHDTIADDSLVQRLPLPLAQLYRRAHNAKTPLGRHLTAFSLWEAGLKLLASVAIVEYVRQGRHDPELTECLRNLARPSLGQWWEFTRRLLPVLADAGEGPFARLRDLVLGKTRDDLPRAAGLDAALLEVLEGKAGGRATVRCTELFDRLVRYRNKVLLGHAAPGQLKEDFHERMGAALLAGTAELLGRLDVLAGRRLLYVGEVRQGGGLWLVQRYELHGESARRIATLEIPRSERAHLPDGERLYLAGSTASSPADLREGGGEGEGALCSLHPLLLYDAEAEEVLFLNARRGRQRAEYLCYTTGRTVDRPDLGGEQRELLARVLGMAVAEEQANQWAAQSQAEEGPAGDGREPSVRRRTLGEFELLSELGRGGMGIVYRAWQPSLGRQVALKKLLVGGEERTARRFRREIRALGRVEHPNLIEVFTSGADGEDWFYAMELVEGAPLSEVCAKLGARAGDASTVDAQTWRQALNTVCEEVRRKEKPLDGHSATGETATPRPDESGPPAEEGAALAAGRGYVHQVVELIRQVAEAAHALHEAGVVHRDIKPGNILVESHGGQAVLMDLGLAQLADDEEGRLTRTRQFVGTLRYASPEQVLAAGRLDRRSDVYSLGATLWELLTLRPLFGATDQTPTPELMQRIQYDEPRRLRAYHPGISRDLEAIVFRCLEKRADRRYATARELAADLRRFQEGRPVRARPVRGLERSWKWAKRRPALAALACVTVLAAGSLIGSGIVYTLRLEEKQRQTQEAKDHAERSAEAERQAKEMAQRRLKQMAKNNAVLTSIFRGLDPRQEEKGGPKLREQLIAQVGRAAGQLDEEAIGDPLMVAELQDTLGSTLDALGESERAIALLSRARAIWEAKLGADHPDTLSCMANLAIAYRGAGRLNEAIALHEETRKLRKAKLGADHLDTLASMDALANAYHDAGRLNKAIELHEETLKQHKAKLGPDHPKTLSSMSALASSCRSAGRLDKVIQLQKEALRLRTIKLGPDHLYTLESMNNLANAYFSADRFADAIRLHKQVLELRKAKLGPDHPSTLTTMDNLANAYYEAGQLADSIKLHKQTLRMQKTKLGVDHPNTLNSMNNLAAGYRRAGKLAEAIKLYEETLERQKVKLGPDHPKTLVSMGGLAEAYRAARRFAEAIQRYEEMVGLQKVKFGPDHRKTLAGTANLAEAYRAAGRMADSIKLLEETWKRQKAKLGPADHDTLASAYRLANLYVQARRFAEAIPLYEEAWQGFKAQRGPDHSYTLFCLSALAEACQDAGRLADSIKLREELLKLRKAKLGTDHDDTLRGTNNLALAYQKQGDHDRAEALFRELMEPCRRKYGPDSPSLAGLLAYRGLNLLQQHKYAEAEPLLRECLTIRLKKWPDFWATFQARAMLGESLLGQKKYAEAEPLLRQGYDGMKARAKTVAPDRASTALDRALDCLVQFCDARGQKEEAEKWRREQESRKPAKP